MNDLLRVATIMTVVRPYLGVANSDVGRLRSMARQAVSPPATKAEIDEAIAALDDGEDNGLDAILGDRL